MSFVRYRVKDDIVTKLADEGVDGPTLATQIADKAEKLNVCCF